MATQNLNQALSVLNALVNKGTIAGYEYTCGKNEKQVLKVVITAPDGVQYSFRTGTTYTKSAFEELFLGGIATANDNSASSDNSISELSDEIEKCALYAKKCAYNYAHIGLDEALTMACSDYGYTYKQIADFYNNWNSEGVARVALATNKNMLYKHGYYVARATLEQVLKQWLASNNMLTNDRFYHLSEMIEKWEKMA